MTVIRKFRIGREDVPFRETAVFKSKKDALAELKRLESGKPVASLFCVQTPDGSGWAIYENLDNPVTPHPEERDE